MLCQFGGLSENIRVRKASDDSCLLRKVSREQYLVTLAGRTCLMFVVLSHRLKPVDGGS